MRNYASSPKDALLPEPVVVEKNWVAFAPALAHEVRNPLSNINLAVDMLRSVIQDEEQRLFLDIIQRASVRVNELLTDLLDHHRQAVSNPQKCSLQQLLSEVLFMTADRLMLKNITVIKEFTSLECVIMADKEKIKMAFTNIIVNAIEAMPDRCGELKVTVKTVNHKCLVEIEDNGIGISMDNLQHIFKPYFTQKTTGMGLGLSTTMEILLANNGRVAVQSEEGVGTRFILSFKSCGRIKAIYEQPVLIVV